MICRRMLIKPKNTLLTIFIDQIADFQRLNKAVGTSKHVVVVGGGFLGSELSCALATRGMYLMIYLIFILLHCCVVQ